MLVEIGSMTSLEVGQKIYDALIDDDKIQLMFLETGRSHALFEEKQFGEFGEASILSIIVNEEDQQNIFKKVQFLNSFLFPLHNALFLETSPGPVKYAASILKICSSELRLPLVNVASSTKKEIKSVLNKLKIKPIKK